MIHDKLTVQRLYRKEKGFTLIELLVVIGILAVLAGVVTLGVTQYIGRGADEAWNAEKHNIQTAVAAWMVDNPGEDPSDATGGTTLAGLQSDGYLIDDPEWTDWTWNNVGRVTNTSRP